MWAWIRNVVMAGLCLMMLTGMMARAEETPRAKVVFLPFSVRVQGGYEYLREGLAEILATRVAGRAGVQVVQGTKEVRTVARLLREGREEKALALLKKGGVDYLVLGNLDREGDKLVVEVSVLGRKKGNRPRQYHRSFPAMDQALPVMDELAWDIASGVFGKKRPEEIQSPDQPVAGGMAAFQTEHPDRAYRRGMYAGIVPGFASGDLQLLAIRRSQKIPNGVNDMAVGDLDGDGRIELVLAGGHFLSVYRFLDDHFVRLGRLPMADYLRIHAVSLADLDGNGQMEIYVSASKEEEPSSSVVLWQGDTGRVIRERIPYYLHVAAPEGRPVLLGQRGNHLHPGQLIDSGVVLLALAEDGSISRTGALTLPRGLTIFDVTWADLDGDGSRELIGINRANQLQVYDKAGRLIFTDPGQYGGSSNYLGTIATMQRSSYRLYIPPMPSLADVDGDGRPDLVVVKNRMQVVKYFKRYRYFEGSSIAALTWREGKLVPLWETRKLPDYTLSCQVVSREDPTAEDGRFRLFFAQGQNNYSFGFWQERSTSLFMYEIGTGRNENEER